MKDSETEVMDFPVLRSRSCRDINYLMDHGFGPKMPGPHFPSSRDWNMPTIKCSRKTCVANCNGECTMPSLIEIGANGKCGGYHKRQSGKKK